MYLPRVVRLTVASWTPTLSAISCRVSGRINSTPLSKKPSCTSTMAEAIFNEGLKAVVAGVNPIQMKTGIPHPNFHLTFYSNK